MIEEREIGEEIVEERIREEIEINEVGERKYLAPLMDHTKAIFFHSKFNQC